MRIQTIIFDSNIPGKRGSNHTCLLLLHYNYLPLADKKGWAVILKKF